MNTVLVVLLAVLLICLAALLTAAQAALGVLAGGDVADEAEDARFGQLLERISQNMSGYREAANFTRVGAQTVATVLIAIWLSTLLPYPWLAVLVAGAVMLVIHVLFTGTPPQSIGHNHPRATLRLLAPLLRGCRILVGTFTDLLGALADALSPLQHRAATVSSEEQLLSMVDAAAEQDVLAEQDRTRIHSVFDFSSTLVREVMVARTDMLTVDAESSVRDALAELLAAGFSRAPITGRDSDDIRGIAYQKDFAKLLLEDPAASVQAQQVARPATFVPESLAADRLLERMQRESIHLAIVIDEYGGVAGLVTLEDLIEELIGEISDEYDRNSEEYEWLSDGALLVSSRMSIADLGELLDVDLEHDDVDSVGGLLTTALGRIPQLGDTATIDGLALVADRVGRRHRVTRIHLRVLEEAASTESDNHDETQGTL